MYCNFRTDRYKGKIKLYGDRGENGGYIKFFLKWFNTGTYHTLVQALQMDAEKFQRYLREQFAKVLFLVEEPKWVVMRSPNDMSMTSYLMSFFGFPYPAWCTDAAKIATWSGRNSRTASVCHTCVHVNTLIDNII